MAIVSAHCHALRRHAFDGAECAVLDSKPALVAQKHDAVAAGELTLAACRGWSRRCQVRRSRAVAARRVIEFAHPVIDRRRRRIGTARRSGQDQSGPE